VFREKGRNKQAWARYMFMSLAWFPFPCQRMATIELAVLVLVRRLNTFTTVHLQTNPAVPEPVAAHALGTGREMN
jgi:hypothetical protein